MKTTLREIAKKNIESCIEQNINKLNELAHTSHNHVWLEVYPDGDVSLAEETDMQTSHWVKYGEKAVATVLEVATCQYCDCDACESFAQAHDEDVDEDEFLTRWGFSKEDVGDNFAQHLKDFEAFNYDMADDAVAAVNDVQFGYFDDEVAEEEEPIYVAFHIGRGGMFHNPGNKTFLGELDYEDLIRENVNDGKLFIEDTSYDPETDAETDLPREEWYATDGAGNIIIEKGDLDRKTGCINFDGAYDTDYAKTIEDLDEKEWEAIINAYNGMEYMSDELVAAIREYCNEHGIELEER